MKQKGKNNWKSTKFKFPGLNLVSPLEILAHSNINCRRSGLHTAPSTREGSTVSGGEDGAKGNTTTTTTNNNNNNDTTNKRDRANSRSKVRPIAKKTSTLQDELAIERNSQRSSLSCMAAQHQYCSIDSFLRLRSFSDEINVEMEKMSHTSLRSSCSGQNTEHSFVSLATSLRSIESRFWKMRMNPYRSSRDSDMYDRLDSREGAKHMSQPDYSVNPQTLLENYVEKKVRFAGVIPDVQIDDVTNRTDVLRIIDEGKKQGRVHHRTTDKEHGTCFTLNVHNIKLTCKDYSCFSFLFSTHSFMLLISSLVHLLTGVPEKCNLAVLYVEDKMQAEEICALVDQCFQLVYADVAIQFININLNGAFGTSVPSSNTQSDSTTINNAQDTALKPSYITTSDQNLTKNNTSSYSRSPKASKRTISVTTESEISLTGGDYSEVIQDYLKKLHKCLTKTELCQFAVLLTARQKGATTGEFCKEVFNLFGQERKHMMTGMGPFIEAKDYHVFEEFLSKNSMALPANGHGTISSFHSNSQLCKDNGITTHSINSGDMDEFDRMMDCISDQIDNMENSVDVDSFVS
eukprot:XP_014770603.1 PREDICTED: cerebral cavernous malformations protein 2 homolog [Octopus bimaculoides]